MEGTGTVEPPTQALALFETVGLPARNLATHTCHAYAHVVCTLLSELAREVNTTCYRHGEETPCLGYSAHSQYKLYVHRGIGQPLPDEKMDIIRLCYPRKTDGIH